MKSTLRLFKALPVPEGTKRCIDSVLTKKTVAHGFVFAPEVIGHYTDYARLLEMVDDLYGRNPERLNQSFHKSWEKVRTDSMENLLIEQMTHYFSTYGAEAAGVYDADSVYIPRERLGAPELDEGLRLVVIHGLTKAELKTKLLELLSKGVALHADTVDDILDVAMFVGISAEDLPKVANREVRAALYDHLGIVPADPIEFLRFVVYRATGKTLLIKNDALIVGLRDAPPTALVRYFSEYERDHGLHHLAEIFYRFKPLFLALRTSTAMRQKVNHIRRLAVKNHKPMKADLLNDVTDILAHGHSVDLTDALARASTFRKVRLAYALRYRMSDADSIVYHIRNGKSWATDLQFSAQGLAAETYAVVMDSIVTGLKGKVDGKKVFIPQGVAYGLPATEKQFSGNVPIGTSVEADDGMVAGIHWENQGHHRIDLDLSLLSITGKLGWDGGYRSANRDVLFSGDMTTAPLPKGATELFSFSPDARGQWMIMCNYFNFNPDVPVPFQVLVGKVAPRSLTMNYTIDPNLLVAQSASTMDVHSRVIGLVVSDDKSCRFYFCESNFGGGRTSHTTRHGEQAREYMEHRFRDTISLNEVLVAAGAELVSDASEADIDLSLKAIDKASLISLLT